jgi:hypothetical protein
MPERVAAGDQQHLAVLTLVSDQPVRMDARPLAHEKDIARAGLFERALLDGKYVAGANDGDHARTECSQAHMAVTCHHVGHQRQHGGGQEFFFTIRHAVIVTLILPHASAMVSNSCSRVNAGFW